MISPIRRFGRIREAVRAAETKNKARHSEYILYRPRFIADRRDVLRPVSKKDF